MGGIAMPDVLDPPRAVVAASPGPGGAGPDASSGITAAFRIAVAAAAIPALDAAFVRPEPGTTAAEHLSRGLVPAVAALAAAVTYPRLPPGWRAALALTCGVV